MNAPKAAEPGSRSGQRGNSTPELLTKAFAQLSERKHAIEVELGRFDDLRKELETINAQAGSLENTVALFRATGRKPSAQTEEAQTPKSEPQSAPRKVAQPAFTGNKRDLVIEVVRASGSHGVAPREIESVFSDRKIRKGRNLIYNALSLLVRQGKMKRENGRYFSGAASGNAPAKAKRTAGHPGLKRTKVTAKRSPNKGRTQMETA